MRHERKATPTCARRGAHARPWSGACCAGRRAGEPVGTTAGAGFRDDPLIIERFPAVVGGIIHATGIHNGPTPPRLAAAFRDETLAVRTRIGETHLSELPTLAAWRKVFRGFAVDPTQYRSAAEALLRRLTKQNELPSIGTL